MLPIAARRRNMTCRPAPNNPPDPELEDSPRRAGTTLCPSRV
jgi:hypothetical protein